MTRYVAFLRGVNVGGINIKMADLKAAFADLGYTDIRTVLASGNVVFDTDETDPAAVKQRIEGCLRATFGYDAWIVLLDLAAVRTIVEAYPFDPLREGWHPYVVLSSDPAALDGLAEVSDDLDPQFERIQRGDGVLYWEVQRGMSVKSAFSKQAAKPTYKPKITTRNLRTLLKILR